MITKQYKIILPSTLEGISKYADSFDVTMCNDTNAKFIYICAEDFKNMQIDNMCLDLFKEYGFLLGEGDYCFLNHKECKQLNDYLLKHERIKNQLSLELYNSLLEFSNEAFTNQTGLGFDF